MGEPAVVFVLEPPQRAALEQLVRVRGTGHALARRARIALAAAEGMQNQAICAVVDPDANALRRLRHRWALW
ncbi:hypothetical protein [Aestuariivirga sp.]|uniref:hypothetical protein n=1 Tax=Aestuariivirga sp. TaxID=2650926 RepID=UPI0025C5C66F|nr:hypothetical protein [Aestuariivirga sp.]MCA3555110.1 hypothetical protein [Aestuariivirga sp.]